MRQLVAVAAVVLASAAPGAAGRAAGAHAAPAGGLKLLSSQRLDPRLVQLTFSTPALAAPTSVRVLLPSGYRASNRRRYPVLYLLHGSFDDYTAWTNEGDAEQLTKGLGLIVVMPDGGSVGNYVNWYNDGAFGLPEWSTYQIGELLPWIDAHYRTLGTRAGRAIAGLSMGGGGAMKYAAAHPDLFVAALSFSGGVHIDDPLEIPVTEAGGAADGDHSPGAIYGLHATEEVRWRNNDTVDLAENLAGVRLWLLTGNGQPGGPNGNNFDPTEYEVHQQAVAVHDRLLALGIPHVWDDYGPGGHQWYYWQRDLKQTLPGLMRVFAHPPAPPSPFSYTNADPDYSVYGWHVHLDRPAMEFSELRAAGPRGFTLRGSGVGHVTTGSLFRPGSTVVVKVDSSRGATTQSLTADRAGRVAIRVPLGPANPDQQYTAQAEANARLVKLLGEPGSGQPDVGGSFVYTTHVSLTGPSR
jgi:S-formylglutathione hydrolase FrmB